MLFNRRPELDEFEAEVRQKAANGRCEGACESHRGSTLAVRVVAQDGTDWGWFSYCDEARQTDEGRGFLLLDRTPLD